MGRSRSLRQRAWEACEGLCYLCGLSMIPNASPGNPLAYTLEHVIPKSRGGSNELDNLSGSHQHCNNFKSDSLMGELPTGYRPVLRWKIKNLLAHMTVVE